MEPKEIGFLSIGRYSPRSGEHFVMMAGAVGFAALVFASIARARKAPRAAAVQTSASTA